MPPLELEDLFDYALLWPVRSGRLGFNRYGQVRVRAEDRVQIPVHWTDTDDEVKQADKSVIRISARIAADRDIPMGSIMWHGTEEDLFNGDQTGTGSGDIPDTGFMQVVTRDIELDFRGRETRYEYGLMRWGSNLPTE